MYLNINALFFFILLISFQNIKSKTDNNINDTIDNENEDTNLEEQKIISEYYKDFYSKNNPIILTDVNYTEYIKNNPYTLLYLHSPFDIHSKNFIPTFKFINEYLNSKNNSVTFLPLRLAAVDLINENTNEIQSLFRLSVFPFFIIYSSIYDNYIQYSGYMNAQSIITFCMKATLDNIIMMNQDIKFENILNPKYTYSAVFIMTDKFNYDDYFRASREFKLAIFGDCIRHEKCQNYFQIRKINKEIYFDIKYNDIILARMNSCKNDFLCEENINSKIEYIPYNYTSYDDFIQFISLNIMPSVFNLTEYNYEIMTKNRLNTLIYIKGKNEKKCNIEISDMLQRIVEQKIYKIYWASILDPINSPNDYELIKKFSIEVEDYLDKGLVIIHAPNKILDDYDVYRLNISNDNIVINEKIIIRFINEFNSGIIKKDIKSELIPKKKKKKNLRMVVGITFNKEILENNNKTIVLILLTLNMKNLHKIEEQIESLTIKFSIYNESIIFNFLDPALNEMPNMPKYDILEKPFYRYYYKDRKKKFVDFKGNYLEQNEIEDWIIDNYGKEYGIEYKYGMRMHIDGMTELLKDKKVFKEYERKQQFEQIKENFGIKDDILDQNEINKESDL